MRISSLLLTAVVGLAGFQGIPGDTNAAQLSCVVKLIDEVRLPADLPSQEAGVLTTLRTEVIGANGQPSLQRVRAGMRVKAGQLLGQIDNQMSQKTKEIAEHKLEIANAEAENYVSVKYAEKACEVAEADFATNKEANASVPGTITKTELRRLALSCEQFKLQIEQAEYELDIAAISVKAQQAQLEAAEIDLARRNIVSPIDGIIIEVFPHEGEWLRPGDPIVHIVRMDQLWVEGSLEYSSSAGVKVGKRVQVTATLPDGRQKQLIGEIDFVSPRVGLDKRVAVRAIVNNELDRESQQWLLRPGSQTLMTIE